ncbi:MAG: translocation/assembly module TamB, partial [Flavobacteriales bacterium]|nr:translocation/assembly module TamB [Flavobacteriales bacterium]
MPKSENHDIIENDKGIPPKIPKKRKYRWARRTLRVLLFLLFIVIGLLALISTPGVQTEIANKVTQNLNEKYGTDINIKRIGLNWKGQVAIQGVYIADHHKDTLIYARTLDTDILNFRSLIKGQLGFGNIDMKDINLYIKTYLDETNDNLSIFSKKFAPEKPDPKSSFLLESKTIKLTNANIRIINENLENPEVVSFNDLNLKANRFKVLNVDVGSNIEYLNFKFNNEVQVTDLQADFSYTSESLNFKNLVLTTQESVLKGDINLSYEEGGLSNFEEEVRIKATLTETTLATNDLNVFYNEFGKDQTIVFSANFDGTLNDFELKELNLNNQGTVILGDFQFKDLLKGTDTYSVTAKNHQISSNYFDLRRFMPNVLGNVLPKQMETLGNFTFNGTTLVTGTNLVTNSKINTALGSVDTDLKMGSINNVDRATYVGTMDIKNFNIGKLTGTQTLGKTSGKLRFDGSGFSQKNLNTEIGGRISGFEFNGYNYSNIEVSGTLENPIFNGTLSIDDPNLKMQFNGLADVSEEQNNYDFEANIDFADLNKLNLITRDSISIFTGSITMDMLGTNVDDVVGTIRFYESTYQNLVDDYYFDDIFVISSFEEDIRTIEVISPDIVTGQMSGRFLLRDLPSLFQNSIASIYTNYVPERTTENQFVNFNFEIFNKIVEIFVPEIQFADNTTIRGSVASDESEFKLNFRTPEVTAFGKYFKRVNLQVDNNNPLFNTYVEIDSIDAGFYAFSNFSLINVTLKDTLFIRSEFTGGPTKSDIFNLSLYHTINPLGKSVVGMKKSDIIFKENKWFINERNDTLNKVVFDNNFKDIIIDSLVLSHNNELIQMSGILRDSSYKDLKLQFRDVDLGKITPEIDSLQLSGNVNGGFNFLQKDKLYYPNSNVTIDNLIVNDNELGDLILDISGNEDLTSYTINTTLTNNDIKSLTAKGVININEINSTIDLDVGLTDFNLAAVSPFGGEVLTDIRGFVSGNARVEGAYKSPNISGILRLNEAGMKIPYLNLDFLLQDDTRIDLTKNRFSIPTTSIKDTEYNTEATLSGYFEHSNFNAWRMNLDINTNRFLVLDTEGDEESLYYGTAFINGNASIYGPLDELVIKVDAVTAPGTTFKIPISDTESIGDDSFIYFLSPAEKRARVSGEYFVREELKGLSLEFDLQITRDALVEVVVDIKNNSTLKGRGEGTLLIEINTLGRFNMWGDFQVYEAVYDFRYAGLVQKEFKVDRGGNISWDGSPERARLDIRATYETQANPSVLLDNPTINRKIPVDVSILLQGELISPVFEYDINFPNISSIVKSELDFKLEDRQQRELQVLYLITTGSFSGDRFSVDQGTSTLVERFSGLVNDIFADQDGKFNVGIDYTQGSNNPNAETSDRVGVTLSTQISERILINGRVGVPVGGVADNTI